MIFVTIGSMFPFDRLTRAMDAIAGEMRGETFFAQIGDGGYQPSNMDFTPMLDRRAFDEKIGAARLVVAHAGMGSVITAMERRKPIIIFPRRVAHGEVTTDHQLATAEWLKAKPGIRVALEESDLRDAVRDGLAAGQAPDIMPSTAPRDFLDKIKNFISAA